MAYENNIDDPFVRLTQSVARLQQMAADYRTESLRRIAENSGEGGSGGRGGVKEKLRDSPMVKHIQNQIQKILNQSKTRLASNEELLKRIGRKDEVSNNLLGNFLQELAGAYVSASMEEAIAVAIEIYEREGSVSIEFESGNEVMETFIDGGGITQIVSFFDMLKEEYTPQTLSDAMFTLSVDRAFKALGNKTNNRVLAQAVKFATFGPL